MVKKVAIGGGVALLVMLLLFGRSTFSYLSTTVSRVHDSVKSAVPVDFELDRARKETSRITPEVRKNMHLIATEEHEIEKLEKRIEVLARYDGLEHKTVAVVVDTDYGTLHQYQRLPETISSGVSGKIAREVSGVRVLAPLAILEWQYNTPRWNAMPFNDIHRFVQPEPNGWKSSSRRNFRNPGVRRTLHAFKLDEGSVTA